jgi:hypothetical protein
MLFSIADALNFILAKRTCLCGTASFYKYEQTGVRKEADVHYQRRCPSVREQTPGLARELGVVRLPMGKKLAMTLFPHKIYSLCSRFTLHSRKKDKLVLHLLFLLRYANNFYFNHD